MKLLHGDCLEQMKTLPDNSVDAIVSDPPYGISFMAKKWDYDVPKVEVWQEAMRVLKPGGHALIACGTRTQHRMVVNIEDAGFEIRDVVSWIYGSGFPKSLNIGKAVDKMDAAEAQLARRYKFTEWVRSHGITHKQINNCLGASDMGRHYTDILPTGKQPAIMTREHLEACRHLFADVPQWVEDECDKRSVESENFKRREVVGEKSSGLSGGSGNTVGRFTDSRNENGKVNITAPATDAAKQWDGWGTALKPACEFFTLARKPLSEKTVAANVLKWGTGGINIDGCRVETDDGQNRSRDNSKCKGDDSFFGGKKRVNQIIPEGQGRFPANLIHDGSQEVLDLFPETKARGNKTVKKFVGGNYNVDFGQGNGYEECGKPYDKGSAARFFYCAKASKKDRDEGLDCEEKECGVKNDSGRGFSEGDPYKKVLKKNNHPTVKPTALMQYLCRLITPLGGTVLDPYMGSGSTGKAALKEGFDFIGCELDEDYYKIAQARITNEQNQ